ncbi:MAG: hypothetical protein KAJ67_05945 [Gemmatimonadetes bacterium]|nr:hypothetical protein [Gemmatimonadota bacterium]
MVPVDWVALAGVIMGTLIVLIPVAGLTARFALKPIVEAVARMRQTQGAAEHLALVEQRLALLEQQQANTESDVGRLLEVQEFQEKLLTNQEEGS